MLPPELTRTCASRRSPQKTLAVDRRAAFAYRFPHGTPTVRTRAPCDLLIGSSQAIVERAAVPRSSARRTRVEPPGRGVVFPPADGPWCGRARARSRTDFLPHLEASRHGRRGAPRPSGCQPDVTVFDPMGRYRDIAEGFALPASSALLIDGVAGTSSDGASGANDRPRDPRERAMGVLRSGLPRPSEQPDSGSPFDSGMAGCQIIGIVRD